ncbi:putative bifunctional diguanylate cyclase/phosphodiesterase [Rhodoplanes sp. SY1]|uniref:putative bifunctional diguanylate cyclase/phosphodiesterase n=1 Tax=Rhodoplanes sp. SY1 TaxID=3166646 RepID=UPI0038B4BE27
MGPADSSGEGRAKNSDQHAAEVPRAPTPRAWAGAARPVSGSVLALAAALACGLVSVAAVLYLVVRPDDSAAVERARASVSRTFGEFRSVFGDAALQRARAISATGAADVIPVDIEQHLAPGGLPQLRHRWAYLVRRDGSLAAAHPAGVRNVPQPVVSYIATFKPAEGSARDVLRSDAALIDRAVPVQTEVLLIEQQPAVVAVVPVGAGSPGAAELTLVLAAPIGGPIVDAMGAMAGVRGLRFDTEPGQASGPLHSQTDSRGRIVGWFGWEMPDDAGNPAWLWLLPVFGGAAFLGFAGLSLVQIRRAAGGLEQIEVELRRIAQEDPLTGMPNRRKIIAALGSALKNRGADESIAFVCLDLDSFKEINEVLGHDIGDRLIAEASERLRAVLPEAAEIGRIDGDEFAVVMAVRNGAVAIDAANACARRLAAPFHIRDQTINVTASVGLALAPRDGESAHELIRRADLAARAAKKAGRGRILAFHHGLEDEINERRFIEQELRLALAENGLTVAYQPIVAGDGLRMVGAEALVRWKHAVRGNIPPGVFVPVAEQAGLMIDLGELVLRRALADARDWPELFIAINLSPIQVRDRGLVRAVASALADSGIDPSRVVLEITEGVLIDNPEDAKQRLKELRALGVKIALDDFGSGYSSLSYLRRLPIDKLKIDKEFVAPLGRSANGGVILQAIVALGRALGLSVLAEGVETEEQRLLLRLAGCDEMQGYLFARPMPAAAFREMMGRGLVLPGTALGDGDDLVNGVDP